MSHSFPTSLPLYPPAARAGGIHKIASCFGQPGEIIPGHLRGSPIGYDCLYNARAKACFPFAGAMIPAAGDFCAQHSHTFVCMDRSRSLSVWVLYSFLTGANISKAWAKSSSASETSPSPALYVPEAMRAMP